LKKLKEGRTKYNEERIKVAEKVLLSVKVAKDCGVFEPCKDHDMLTEALGNPEH
jgi:hypothetical protein